MTSVFPLIAAYVNEDQKCRCTAWNLMDGASSDMGPAFPHRNGANEGGSHPASRARQVEPPNHNQQILNQVHAMLSPRDCVALVSHWVSRVQWSGTQRSAGPLLLAQGAPSSVGYSTVQPFGCDVLQRFAGIGGLILGPAPNSRFQMVQLN